MSNKRNIKFRLLAEKRMSRVLSSLKSIENLANKQNYTYTSSEVRTLFESLRHIGSVTLQAFTTPTPAHLSTPVFLKIDSASKKQATFRKLATLRTQRVIKDMLLIRNLANKTNYAYTDEEIKQLSHAYFSTVTKIEGAFLPTSTHFSFQD